MPGAFDMDLAAAVLGRTRVATLDTLEGEARARRMLDDELARLGLTP